MVPHREPPPGLSPWRGRAKTAARGCPSPGQTGAASALSEGHLGGVKNKCAKPGGRGATGRGDREVSPSSPSLFFLFRRSNASLLWMTPITLFFFFFFPSFIYFQSFLGQCWLLPPRLEAKSRSLVRGAKCLSCQALYALAGRVPVPARSSLAVSGHLMGPGRSRRFPRGMGREGATAPPSHIFPSSSPASHSHRRDKPSSRSRAPKRSAQHSLLQPKGRGCRHLRAFD